MDLILLDYEMPIVDGPQVFEMLKSEEDSKDIPVVFLTGNGTREGVLRVMELGPAGYVLKGATKQELQAKIKSVLAKHGKGN
ncbi:MAG: response regulator [Eubacterium sp.]|nr:response regulator [Eubacterium sp.]